MIGAGLKRAAVVLPVAWTGAWLTYYGMCIAVFGHLREIDDSAYTDTVRRSHIRERHRHLQAALAGLSSGAPDEHAPATEAEKEALRRRWADITLAERKGAQLTSRQILLAQIRWAVLEPLCRMARTGCLGMGFMEDCDLYHHWKAVSQPVNLTRRAVTHVDGIIDLCNRGVPDERPIPDLPIERPDFKLLFGSDTGPATPAVYPSNGDEAEKASAGNVKRRTDSGGEDIDITDKLTMTWVSRWCPVKELAWTL